MALSWKLFFGPGADADDAYAWFYEGLGKSGKMWNMISINKNLRRWRGRALWGLEWLGPALPQTLEEQKAGLITVRTQFYWLTQGPRLARRYCRTNHLEPIRIIDRSVEAIYKRLMSAYDSVEIEPGLVVSTGDIVEFQTHLKDPLPKTRMAINIQWAASRVAAMSGAADVSEEVEDGRTELRVREEHEP